MTEPQSDQILTVKVNALAYGGSFIGSTIEGPQDSIGKKALLRNVIPGELAKARIVKNDKRIIHAETLQVLEQSTERVNPPCLYFGICGGCDLQHMNIKFQRLEKKRMVLDTLRIQAGIEPRQPPVMLGEDLPEYAYRKRISMHLDETGKLGFFKLASGEVVDIEQCLISSDEINDALKQIRPFLSELCASVVGVSFEQFEKKIFIILRLAETAARNFKVSDSLLAVFPNLQVLKNEDCIYSAGFSYPAGHFSQINESANKVLNEYVLKNSNADEITELYAGGGNFGLPLARMGKLIKAVEIDKELVKLGRRQAEEGKLNNRIKFFQASCEAYLKENKLTPFVIIDPPRSGAKNIIRALCDEAVESVLYISCNLPSLCRDLKSLSQAGFSLQSLALLDMFPQTHHIETVCLIERSL